MFTIARNETNHFYKKYKKLYYTDKIEYFEVLPERNEDETTLNKTLLKELLENFIDSIKKDRRRSVFYLSIIEQKKQKEIAELLNITIRMVKYELKKAKESLKKLLKKNKIDINLFE